MRISNKISINGDTLLIFEQKTEMQLKQIAMEIYKELSRKFSGSGYDVMDELEAMKKAGILDSEEQNIISTYLRDFGDENNPINQSVFKDNSMEEGSFNPMKSKKMYYHVLEDGGYGRIGHQGYYNTEAEAQKRAEKLSDMFPKSDFYVEAYPSKKEPVTVTMEEGSFNPMKSKKMYYHVLEDGGYGRIGHQGYYNTEAEAQKRAEKLSDMFPKSDFYVEAYPSKKEPVTVTMEEGSFNPMKRNSNNKEIASSEFNGNIITWYDYEVEEKNIDGGGYTDSISLMGNDEAGNEYTAMGTKTFDDVDDIEDIEMVSSITEAKKEKKVPADKKKADKTNYGNKDMSDVDMVNPYELKKGIRIEMVDTEDYVKAMDKAVKKLKKDPMFYSNLIADAKETKGKRADVPTEVKDKKLNKVSDKMKDKANEMEVSKKDVTKKNANDSLNKSEKAKGKPKGVKEMTMTPKKSKGMKSMDVPGKEKKTNLKESFNLWESFKKNILR